MDIFKISYINLRDSGLSAVELAARSGQQYVNKYEEMYQQTLIRRANELAVMYWHPVHAIAQATWQDRLQAGEFGRLD